MSTGGLCDHGCDDEAKETIVTEHRTDWHRLSVRTDDGSEVDALGWWHYKGAVWVLDRVVDGGGLAYVHDVTDHGPVVVLVLPAPSGPVVKQSWGWECGNVEATDLADADGWAAELPQHIADSRSIAAHIRGLTPTLAEDVATWRSWTDGGSTPAEGVAAITRILDAITGAMK